MRISDNPLNNPDYVSMMTAKERYLPDFWDDDEEHDYGDTEELESI